MKISMLILPVVAWLYPATLWSAQNLILNGDFSQAAADYSSDYSFIASGISYEPGTYGLRSFSQDFNPNYTSFIPYSGSNGVMMLVDGYYPADRVWSETVPVAPNQTYLFSSWVTPSDAVNLPTLRLLINGVQVGADFALPAAGWTNFAVAWNSAASTTATIAIIDANNNPLSSGDDFSLADLSLVNVSGAPVPGITVVSNAPAIVWPAWASNYALQVTTNLAAANWTPATNGILIHSIANAVSYTGLMVTNRLPAAFYRLSPQ